MTTWFTSDHHFGHANIIRFCNRPFDSVEQMDQAMIDRWNSVVGPGDTVYHLGDFTLTDSLSPWIHALQFGQLKIVPGGHDYRWLARFNIADFWGRVSVEAPLVSLEFPSGDKYPHVIVLCHYAMRVWDRSHHGSLHLYGHSHGNLPRWENSLDIGVDSHDFTPVSLEQVQRMLTGSA